MKTTGLTLGKFAPFHKGHELLIRTALEEVDELLVMVYPTDLITVPLQVRAGWIKTLFPRVTIIEAWDGPDGYGDTPEIKRQQEQYILRKLNGRRITHFYSSEFYGQHVSKALSAIDRRVDEVRQQVPISGSALRAEPYRLREYLSPVVYRDLVLKICLLGAPSTGKTTLAKVLADTYQTRWMPEYGAEFWLEHQVDRRITLQQFEQIAPAHIKREEAQILESNCLLICDTCPITTYVFAQDYHGQAGPTLTACAQAAEKAYDLFLVCDTDIPYHDTWDRSGPVKREWFQKQILDDLRQRRLSWFTLSGDLPTRLKTARCLIDQLHPFANLADLA